MVDPLAWRQGQERQSDDDRARRQPLLETPFPRLRRNQPHREEDQKRDELASEYRRAPLVEIQVTVEFLDDSRPVRSAEPGEPNAVPSIRDVGVEECEQQCPRDTDDGNCAELQPGDPAVDVFRATCEARRSEAGQVRLLQPDARSLRDIPRAPPRSAARSGCLEVALTGSECPDYQERDERLGA